VSRWKGKRTFAGGSWGSTGVSYESGRQVRIPLVAVSRARLEVEF
jgi:hypothetical protein